ncbi:Ubiquitin carboxyl-terminal hydrolase 24 [Mizuhopecten yessoensis]|uniref:Ubiquitin carboxyl-terminal hydrolase 24 n=1 Tax=Mizuhopecten yessoensis TaxID=6573 RepID=A0A210R3J4_MIZYE|nr:Ubiquitin carboxyl-terminal hydrolase 24 [Mizuhopecten yessoensis]
MSEYYWNPSSTSTVSNEDSNRKSFQRTISAQSTLDDANALLMELETHEGTGSALDMDTNGNKSDMETDTSVKTTAPTDSQTDTHMSTEEEDKKPNS